MTPVIVEGQNLQSYGPQLRLQPQGATPPTATYMSADNQIAFYTSSSVAGFTLTATARILLPDGRVSLNQFQFVVPNTRVASGALWNLPEGFLLSLTVFTSQQSQARVIFVQCQLVQTNQNPPLFTSVLCAGYPSQYVPISFPVGVNLNNMDCYGNIRVITGTLPAPGNNISEQVPTNARWRMIAVTFFLSTSAAVANRNVFLQFQEAGTPYSTILMNTTPQTAALNWVFTAGSGLTAITSPTQFYASASFSAGQLMRQTDIMQTNVQGMQAGDQLSAPTYMYEEWQCP